MTAELQISEAEEADWIERHRPTYHPVWRDDGFMHFEPDGQELDAVKVGDHWEVAGPSPQGLARWVP